MTILNYDRMSEITNNSIDDDQVWVFIKSFFDSNSLVSHHLNSFNDVIHDSIPNLVKESSVTFGNPETELYHITFGNIYFHSPVIKGTDEKERILYPMEAVYREASYSSNIYIDIIETKITTLADGTKTRNIKRYDNIFFGSIPVMVRSELCNLTNLSSQERNIARECKYDTGGYFIIKGARKILVPQERSAFNHIYVFRNRKKVPHYDIYSEIRSISPSGTKSTTATIGLFINKNQLLVNIPYVSEDKPIPLGIIFKAYGIFENDIGKYVFPPSETRKKFFELIIPSLEQSIEYKTQDEALLYIGKRIKRYVSEDEEKRQEQSDEYYINYAKHLLTVEFLPHLGKNITNKLFFLGFMIYKLFLTYLGFYPPEDRDHYMNKRIITSGVLYSSQFYAAFKKVLKIIQYKGNMSFKKNNINTSSFINNSTITISMSSAISSNNWLSKVSKSQGISQAFERYNRISTLSNLRKINTPMSESGKVIAPRNLHGSHWGIMCISETPESKKVGLLKNLALMGIITIGSNAVSLTETIINTKYIYDFEEILKDLTKLDFVKVFVNGNWLGTTDKYQTIIDFIITQRRSANISLETSVYYNPELKALYISCDGGRMCRPLFIVKDNHLVATVNDVNDISKGNMLWPSLFVSGIVELVDKAEEENSLIALFPSVLSIDVNQEKKYTHCEMHPSMMYGVSSSIAPFPDHDQAPRITLQCAMGKQAVGIPFSNYIYEMTGTFNVLNYVQRPLTMTRSSTFFHYEELAAGINAIVAICPLRGLNQEDSLIFDKQSIDNGFMSMVRYYTYYATAKIASGFHEEFGIPTKEQCHNLKHDVSKLDSTKFVALPGTQIQNGDIIIGRITKYTKGREETCFDSSIVYTENMNATIQVVQFGTNVEGYNYVRVKVAQPRNPVIGNKFSSRHGQKGTVGGIINHEDMPYNPITGIVPNILMNPLAIPSRMTIAQLIECLLGKTIAHTSMLNNIDIKEYFEKRNGLFSSFFGFPTGDATPFRNFDSEMKEITEELKKYGLNVDGDEQLVDGFSGEPLDALVFVGPVYYEMLKHFSIDKIHARARGPRTALTRQPKEGRAVGGGFRIGGMEKDCIAGQGCTAFLKDRMMEQSDEFSMWFCGVCGLPAYTTETVKECKVCGSKDLNFVKIPYGAKLLFQELMGMNIVPRVVLNKYGEATIQV